MIDYIVCFIFWSLLVFMLYAFGNILIREEEAQSVKLMAGYLGYSFLVAIGGIIIQLANLKWSVFAIYMGILLIGIIVSIIIVKIKRGSIFSCSLKGYIENNWYIFLLCFILISILFCYFRPFWYGNHMDDGYYLTKVATLPYGKNSFRMNYPVGVEKFSIDSYVFNTWELEASFYVKILHVNVTLFLRLYQSAYHYFIMLNCIFAFGYKLLTRIEKSLIIKHLQYTISIVLIFFVYYVYLEDSGLFYVKDMFHLNSAMYYGASLSKMIVIFLLLLFYIEQEKINCKMVIGIGLISVVMISKTGVVLPVIFVTSMAYFVVLLFENPNKKMKNLAFLLGTTCVILSVIIPAGIDEQKEVYKFVASALHSPIVILSVFVFVLSFTLKDKIVYRLNGVLIISGGLMLIPYVNDLFEFISFYSFVAARAWSTYVYTFVIINAFYLYLFIIKYLNDKAVTRIYMALSVILTVLLFYGYRMDGGELFVTDELPAKTNIVEDIKRIYHNHFFIPNTTIELGNVLEEISGKSEQQLIVASPQWSGIDGTVHTLATQLRIFAPNVISISASERYPVEEESKVYGYDQKKYDDFFNIPGDYTRNGFEQEIKKYGINCVVVQNNQRSAELEDMGFVRECVIQDGVYEVWCKEEK